LAVIPVGAYIDEGCAVEWVHCLPPIPLLGQGALPTAKVTSARLPT
jgi:hypothetical protein